MKSRVPGILLVENYRTMKDKISTTWVNSDFPQVKPFSLSLESRQCFNRIPGLTLENYSSPCIQLLKTLVNKIIYQEVQPSLFWHSKFRHSYHRNDSFVLAEIKGFQVRISTKSMIAFEALEVPCPRSLHLTLLDNAWIQQFIFGVIIAKASAGHTCYSRLKTHFSGPTGFL